MIKFPNGGCLVQTLTELPTFEKVEKLYVDFETSSGHPKLKSFNPWKHCEIAGIGLTVDDCKDAWYVPIGHNEKHWNLQKDEVLAWLQVIYKQANQWVNHNVKYDAHVAANAGLTWTCDLVDTLTLAKIIDSDRVMRGGYSLSALSMGWLEEDVSKYENRLKAFLKGCRSHDYGDVPADILAEYGCQDVITERKLYHYINQRCPEMCRKVWNMEVQLTSALFDIEQTGLCIDPTEVQKKQMQVLYEMLALEEKLNELTGMNLRPHVNDDCYDLLCNKYGLPVLGYTDEGNPSFDKGALSSYQRHPLVESNKELMTIISLLLQYRTRNTLNSLFLETFLNLHVDGVLHPSYNQAVRTGRMSCSQPNSQQQNTESKALIHPPPGYAFISADYSQIEFRLIVHFIKNQQAIAAYAENPDTDFHEWVAEMCGIPRKPAKNVNFAMGYGGGKERVLSMLASNMELVGEFASQGDFDTLCRMRAEEVYSTYHSTLPELKQTSYNAARVLKLRGYVFNPWGRHRHLAEVAAFRAFNSIVQSSAAELIKEKTIETAPRYNDWFKERNIKQVASVHDETLFQAPITIAKDPETHSRIASIMESPSVELRIPVRVNIGVSENSWAEAGDQVNQVQITRNSACRERL